MAQVCLKPRPTSPKLTDLGRNRPELGRVWPNLADLGGFETNNDRLRPSSAGSTLIADAGEARFALTMGQSFVDRLQEAGEKDASNRCFVRGLGAAG